jgi:hypothetical protein
MNKLKKEKTMARRKQSCRQCGLITDKLVNGLCLDCYHGRNEDWAADDRRDDPDCDHWDPYEPQPEDDLDDEDEDNYGPADDDEDYW